MSAALNGDHQLAPDLEDPYRFRQCSCWIIDMQKTAKEKDDAKRHVGKSQRFCLTDKHARSRDRINPYAYPLMSTFQQTPQELTVARTNVQDGAVC